MSGTELTLSNQSCVYAKRKRANEILGFVVINSKLSSLEVTCPQLSGPSDYHRVEHSVVGLVEGVTYFKRDIDEL